MATHKYIPVDQFCKHYNIEAEFIDSLIHHGLTEIIVIENKPHVAGARIRDIERMIRMHYDLDINFEGIEAISHLLDRMEMLQKELTASKNRLMFFES